MKLHLVITKEEHMIWYMSIMHYIITLDLDQIPLRADLQYKQYTQQI